MNYKLIILLCVALINIWVLSTSTSCVFYDGGGFFPDEETGQESGSVEKPSGGDTQGGSGEGGASSDAPSDGENITTPPEGTPDGGDSENQGGNDSGSGSNNGSGDSEGGSSDTGMGGSDNSSGDSEGGSSDTGSNTPDDNESGGDNGGESGDEGGASGNPDDGSGCEHTFSKAWSYNTTHHWHAATCEHGEMRTSYATHSDKNEDGVCDSCGYESGHTHTYEKAWTSDDDHHWHKASCSHTNEKAGYSLHSDNDYNGSCDECSHHVHNLTSSGKCRFCGEQVKPVDFSSLTNVLLAINAGYNKINGGKISYSFGRDRTTQSFSNSKKTIEYKLGQSASYYKVTTESSSKSFDNNGEPYDIVTTDVYEKWHQRLPDNTYFGVYRESGGDFKIDAAVNSDSLTGYFYAVSTLANGHGAENILSALYNVSRKNYSTDFELIHEDGSRRYAFSFNSLVVNELNTTSGVVYNVNYFIVSVEFEHDVDYALTYLKITCKCYTNDPGSDEDGHMITEEIDLDYNTKDGTFTMRDNAVADVYTFEVTQYIGEKSYVMEYPKSYFEPSTYEVYSDETFTTLSEETITVTQGEYARFYLKEPGAGGKTFTSGDGISFSACGIGSDDSGLVALPFSVFSSQVRFYAASVGEYEVTIEYKGTVKVFKVIVTEAPLYSYN